MTAAMKVFREEEVREMLPWPRVMAAIEEMLHAGCEAPLRQHYRVEAPGGADATLLLMPAWVPGKWLGVKIVTFFPANAGQSLPTISGAYALFDGATGRLAGLIDAEELTARRTAATSAIAAQRLARQDARVLLMVGTGRLSKNLVAAHAAVRSFEEIIVWGRSLRRAEAVVGQLSDLGFNARASDDIEGNVRVADVISCATSATDPLVRGAWLKEGAHLDLVGGFRPDMREVDDDVVRRASAIVVDTRGGAKEAGDIAQPLRSGALAEAKIKADLAQLVRGEYPSRRSDREITLFKSVGFALQDLAAARSLIEAT